MIMLVLGGLLIAVASAMDLDFRLRMKESGYKWALPKGGAFDYSAYHKVRKEHGWPAWPVYVMWIGYISGIAFLIAGFFAQFGISPPHG
jgi:hypothetical protein